jgi:hypothetical protein
VRGPLSQWTSGLPSTVDLAHDDVQRADDGRHVRQ